MNINTKPEYESPKVEEYSLALEESVLFYASLGGNHGGFGDDLYWGTTSQLISGKVQYWKWQIFKVVKE